MSKNTIVNSGHLVGSQTNDYEVNRRSVLALHASGQGPTSPSGKKIQCQNVPILCENRDKLCPNHTHFRHLARLCRSLAQYCRSIAQYGHSLA